MAAISTLEQLRVLLRSQGVRTAYVKLLSPRQDNSKNQIYLGSGLDGVTNLFPAKIHVRSGSESLLKRKSAAGVPKLEAQLDFAWLSPAGQRDPAPHTRIIDYFQYPEVRLSGFLRETAAGPRALIRDEQAQYGRRILVLGTSADGKVLGLVLTERDDPLVRDFPDLPLAQAGGVLRVLTLDGTLGIPPEELLRQELEAIVRAGWHSGRINRGGMIEPFSGNQGGGYTLEALLGVAANAQKKSDRHGFEIKSYASSRISLMTPAPDGGYQKAQTFREFMERWGRAGDAADGSRRFTGLYRCGEVYPRTGIGMRLSGYDRARDEFDHPSRVAVELFSGASGEVVASWSIEKLANCWNAKHANALYITFDKRTGPSGVREYRYADRWLVGKGTDVWRLLRAIDRGVVFYDPADAIYCNGEAKARPQWRINTRDLPSAMGELYAWSGTITV